MRNERDHCATFLTSHVRDQELKIGKHKFRVEKVNGVTVYVTKGKGRKLYVLHVSSLTPCTIEVREVWPGSGSLKEGEPPVAVFQP